MKKRNIIIVLIVVIAIIILGICMNLIKSNKEKKEYEINKISEYKYFVVKEESGYGVIDKQGNKIIETKYDDIKIPNPEKAVFICYENEKTKVLDAENKEILKQYDNIEPLRLKNVSSDLMYEKSTLKYKKDDKYGIINIEGKKLTNAIYEEIDTLQFKEGELLIKKNGKYGVININGATLVKADYDKIEVDKYYDETNGYKNAGYIVTRTTEDGYRYGYVDIKGKEIVKTKYNDLNRINDIKSNDIYIICAENGKYGLIKNSKKIIENEYQSIIYNESNNTVTAQKGKKYGVILIDGKTIVPFEYKQIDITGKNIYATSIDTAEVKVFDENGKETNIDKDSAIIDIENTDYQIRIQSATEKTGYSIYKNDTKLTNNDYIYIEYLYDNYFMACDSNGKIGIIDDKENKKVDFKYNSIVKIENTELLQMTNNSEEMTEIYSKDFKKVYELKKATVGNKEDYIKVYNEDTIQYISKNGELLKNTDVYNNEIFAIKRNDKWGFASKDGKVIIDCKYDKVTEINQYGFAGIKLDGKWGVIDKEGKIIVEPKYQITVNEPNFIGEYYQVVYGNGEIYYTK